MVNAYAVLVLVMNVIRLPVAFVVVTFGTSAVMKCRRSLSAEGRKALEDRLYLLLMLALLLVTLNVLSWPLLYWLLQSYVPELPGAMCIYGVTRLGAGSLGASRFLPGLIAAVQLLKPALLFLCGAWFVLYWLNRRTEHAVLIRRVLLAMLLMGIVSVADSALETSYLVIPKRENLPTLGCCTTAIEARASRLAPGGWLPAEDNRWLYGAYYGVNGVMILALGGRFTLLRGGLSNISLILLLGGMLAALLFSSLFLVEIAAPIILHLPHHHCAYDLLAAAPESTFGIAMFLLASLSVGWACVAAWLARRPETAESIPELIDKMLFLALCGYSASLLLFSVELALNFSA